MYAGPRVALGSLVVVMLLAANLVAPTTAVALATFPLTCTQTGDDTTTPYSVSVPAEMVSHVASGCGGVLTIPSGVTSIAQYPFTSSSSATNPHITSIVFPSTLTEIRSVGLANLTGVTSLTIPASVTSVANQALVGMTGLQSIRIEGSAISTTDISNYAFRFDTVHLSVGNGSVTFNSIAMNDAIVQSLTLDDTGSGAVSFGDESFKGQPLSSLTLPPRVTTIGDRAFGTMPNLTEVNFGPSTPGLTSIHSRAFEGTNIASVRYCGGNAVLTAYLDDSLPNADVFCSPTQVPSTPTITSTSAGNGSVTVTATPGADNSGRALSNYSVQYSSDGTTWTTYTRTPASTNPSITVPNLTNGTEYQFKVAAVSLAGASSYSAPSSSVTPRTLAGSPTGVAGTPGNGQVAVSWVAPGSNGGAAVSDYIVQWRESAGPGAWTTFADGTSTATTSTVTGLTNGTGYDFRVAGVNIAGTGAFSSASPSIDPGQIVEPDPVYPPGEPQGVSALAGERSATVSWSAPTAIGSFPVSHYQVVSSPTGGTCLTSILSCEIRGLRQGSAYTFQVRALSGAGWGPWSPPSDAVTPTPSQPPSPALQIAIADSGRAMADRRRVYVTLRTTGIAAGSYVQPWVRSGDSCSATAGAPVKVGADGTATWSRRAWSKLTVWFTHGDEESARVNLPGRGAARPGAC